ncbi:hypothetical protein BDW74DRAFT_22395 [Aspergillus multicolor]|uniref:uncharacterized protein n=1 Tax=Aspergillus multicolor TaxID=41759 RepID=UPI003CCD8460
MAQAEALSAPGDGPGLVSVSRASTVPAIVTSDPSGLTTNNNDHGIADESSPITPVRSGLTRTSQSFPIASDVASGSSGNQQDATSTARKPLRPGPAPYGSGSGSGLVGRNSTSSPTILESAESSAIDPLSQHIIKRTNTQKSIPLRLLGRASYEAEAGGSDRYSPVDQGLNRGDQAPQRPLIKEKKYVLLAPVKASCICTSDLEIFISELRI